MTPGTCRLGQPHTNNHARCLSVLGWPPPLEGGLHAHRMFIVFWSLLYPQDPAQRLSPKYLLNE